MSNWREREGERMRMREGMRQRANERLRKRQDRTKESARERLTEESWREGVVGECRSVCIRRGASMVTAHRLSDSECWWLCGSCFFIQFFIYFFAVGRVMIG